MIITIEDAPNTLNELLWVREAFNLQPLGDDLPPLLTETPEPVRLGGVAAPSEWREAWPGLWHDSLTHAATVREAGLLSRLSNSVDGSGERSALLAALHGPSWRERFGNEAFDANSESSSFQSWSFAQFERLTASRRHLPEFDQTPERRSLDALIPAWQAGLRVIVVIPCHGTFTRVVGASGLLLTVETRANPERYSAALRVFA